MVVLYVGLGSAQFLLLLSSPQSAQPFMLVSVLISLALVPIVLSAHQVPDGAATGKVRLIDLYRNTPVGVVGVSVSGLTSATIYSMGPVYARLSGLQTRGVAAFMGVSILAGVLTQYPVGRLSDRMDRRTVIAAVCTLATVVAGVLFMFKDLPHAVIVGLSALLSGVILTLYSLSVSHANDKLEPGQAVAASSKLLLLNGSAAALGPILAGSLMAYFGAQAYFGTLGSLTAALLLFDLWRKWRARPVPPSQKVPFVGAEPRT
jgi:MFS family permease